MNNAQHRAVAGVVVRTMYALRARSVSAIEILYVPFLSLTAYAFLRTSREAVKASPLYQQMERVAPLNVWLVVIVMCAVLILVGVLVRAPLVMLLGYVASATVWLTVAGLLYHLTHTYQTSLIYGFVGLSAIYRAADLWVIRHDRSVSSPR